MSMTAIGGPWSSRPLTELTVADGCEMAGERLRRPVDEAAYKATRGGFFERFATARQTRICHEILVGIERFLARRGLYAGRTAVRQDRPTLLIILQIRDHNLIQNLFMHSWIENRA